MDRMDGWMDRNERKVVEYDGLVGNTRDGSGGGGDPAADGDKDGDGEGGSDFANAA